MSHLAKTTNLNTLWTIKKPLDFSFNPYLFASTCVFVREKDFETIISSIRAIESIFTHPQFSQNITSFERRDNRGLFCAYDFHITDLGPKLIEIITNAGGCLLNYYLMRAQTVDPPNSYRPFSSQFSLDAILIQFKKEWEFFDTKNKSLSQAIMAIVDDSPLEQFLSLEFELFQKILASHLCSTYIIDAKDLQYKNHELFIIDKDGHKVIIDFVYNRLTDFYLESKEHQNLQSAYEQNACLITPNRKNVPDCWIGLELTEGKNRQVRRMTAAIGHPTLRLVRTKIGHLELLDLPPGSWRELSPKERKLIFKA